MLSIIYRGAAMQLDSEEQNKILMIHFKQFVLKGKNGVYLKRTMEIYTELSKMIKGNKDIYRK